MHELGIAEELLRAILPQAERHGAKRITRVSLRIGVLRAVVADNLSFLFEHVARGTIAEGALLAIEEEPVVVACPACGARSGAQMVVLECPACGAEGIGLSGGDNLQIVDFDIDD
ncbi:MAG TPA: hydrogenase maturation nickel metallochaperone HypA [Candidatus Deferrimicrobiaceae bacterium]|jgi:hydrogenase nickel incorporation protein HypA/HybF